MNASSIQGDGIYPFILYHGTDETIWNLTNEKRTEVKTACRKVIEYLAPVYKAKLYELQYVQDKRNKEILGNEYIEFLNSVYRGISTCDDNALFQYKDFYVTNSFDRAKGYAHKAVYFGEIGYHAHYLRTGAERIGLDLPEASDEVKSAIETILWFDSLPHAPVILSIEGVKTENLTIENGINIPGIFEIPAVMSFRLFGELTNLKTSWQKV